MRGYGIYLEDRISELLKYPYILEWRERLLENVKSGRRSVVLFFDGLGNALSGWRLGSVERYRTVFPSSTPTFFYSFYSGLDPGQHCFLEWFMKWKEEIIAVPPWVTSDGKALSELTKKDVFPFKTIPKLLKGLNVAGLTPFADSPFTKYSLAGASIFKIGALADLLAFDYSKWDFVIVYWPSPDRELHKYWKSKPTRFILSEIKRLVREFLRLVPMGTDVYILGDHGQTYANKDISLSGKLVPTGGGRIAFFGEEPEFSNACVCDIKTFEPLMGSIRRLAIKRYGRHIALADKEYRFQYLWYKTRDIGHHGGLTDEEILVDVLRISR